jgi:alpha-N-acetylglucosamine transferase
VRILQTDTTAAWTQSQQQDDKLLQRTYVSTLQSVLLMLWTSSLLHYDWAVLHSLQSDQQHSTTQHSGQSKPVSRDVTCNSVTELRVFEQRWPGGHAKGIS